MTTSDRIGAEGPRCVRLSDYRCLTVSGPDAATFLQGQLSSDLDSPQASTGQMASFNTPQGRVIAILRLLRLGDEVCLILPAELAEPVIERLGRFILRARVEMEISATVELLGLMPQAGRSLPALPGCHRLALPVGGLAMAWRTRDGSAMIGSPPWREARPEDWAAAETAAGLPEVSAATSGQFVPQMLNLDLLGGISFTKGCFVGQEVVARAHHLGRVKRRTHLFAGPGGCAEPGDSLYRGDRAAGAVVRTAALDAARDLILASVSSGPGPLGLAGQADTLEPLELPYPVPGAPD